MVKRRIYTFTIEEGIEPPLEHGHWSKLADEMKFGESVIVANTSERNTLCSAIYSQASAHARYRALKDLTTRFRVWKLKKE